MPATAQYLAILDYNPKIDVEDVPARPQLLIRYNIAVDTAYVEDDALLNQHFVLTQTGVEVNVPLHFVGWDPVQRLLTLEPQADLEWGQIYNVTALKTLPNVQGRKMVQDRMWSFRVGGSSLGQVQPLSPGDSTAFTAAPQLSWEGIAPAGSPVPAVTYEVQLADDWSFSGIRWSTTLTDPAPVAGATHQVAIGAVLPGNKAFYWRVRATSGSLTGQWSDPRVFWIGSNVQASPDSAFGEVPDPYFTVEETSIPNGQPHLSAWPALALTFSADVDPATATAANVTLVGSPVDGRLDTPPVTVTGAVAVDGAILTFAPDAGAFPAPAQNTRYRLTVSRAVKSATLGERLDQPFVLEFTGPYTPIYGGTVACRQLISGIEKGFADGIDDGTLYFYMWRSSLEVNDILFRQYRRTWMRNITTPLALESLDDIIQYQPTAVTLGMNLYVEYDAAVSLLDGHYYDLLEEAGRQTMLATFQHRVDVALLEELRKRIKELEEERDKIAARFLAALVIPRTVRKGQYWWTSDPRTRDWSTDGPPYGGDPTDGFGRGTF